MERTEHSMLVGSLADEFADSTGRTIRNDTFRYCKNKMGSMEKIKHVHLYLPRHLDVGTGELFGSHDTIGTIAIDAGGTNGWFM